MPRGRRKKAFKLKLKKTTLYSLSSVGLIAIGGLIILSFSRQGPLLEKLYLILDHYFGWGIIFFPFLFIVAGLMLSRLQWRITRPNVFAGGVLLSLALVSLTQAGVVGFEIWQNLAVLVTGVGAFLLLLGLALIGFVITFNTSLEEMLLFMIQISSSVKKALAFFIHVKSKFFAGKFREKCTHAAVLVFDHTHRLIPDPNRQQFLLFQRIFGYR